MQIHIETAELGRPLKRQFERGDSRDVCTISGDPILLSRIRLVMPRIKRWFPVSHDINHSPTMRNLAREFGLAGWRVWFEILSIADRSGQDIDCTSEGALSRLTSAAETRLKRTRSVVEALLKAGCIATIDAHNHVTRVVNYAEYHRTREQFVLHPDLTRPNHTKPDHIEDKKKRAQAPLVVLPDWVPQEAWLGFCEYRKSKKGWTRRAAILNLNKLEQLRNEGNDPEAVLNQSVSNGWAGLFPIRSQEDGRQRTNNEPRGFNSVREFIKKHNR